MLTSNLSGKNPDAVKENIRKKFQDAKLPLVDEVIELDSKYRKCLQEAENLKAQRNKLSKANGPPVRPAEEVHRRGQEGRAPGPRSMPTTPPSRRMPTSWLPWKQTRKRWLPGSRRSCTPSPDDRPPACPSAPMTAATWKASGSASRLCRISPSRTTRDHGEL